MVPSYDRSVKDEALVLVTFGFDSICLFTIEFMCLLDD